MKDFFAGYHKAKVRSYIAPSLFALVLSVAIVSTIHTGGNLRMISASVIEGVNPSIKYDADLILERTQGNIIVRIGKDAQKVDTVNFSLIGDPTVFLGLTTTDTQVSLSNKDPGYYNIKISLGNADLKAGDIIASLDAKIEDKASLAGNDAILVSEGVSYDLSIKN